MTTGPTTSRTKKKAIWGAVLVACLALLLVSPTLLGAARERFGASPLSIEGAAATHATAFSHASAPTTASPSGPPYITSVSANRRYLLDQFGKPLLVRGDSPWSLLTRLTPEQAQLWFTNRESHGYNAAIVSLIGATANGGPSDKGATYDGIAPFVDGNILRWNDPYWERAHNYIQMAADHGISVLLYPIDGWTIGHAFTPASVEQCRQYGDQVARHFQDLPNIVWMTGGDYLPENRDGEHGSDTDHCMDAMMHGIRATGDTRPFSIQLDFPKELSTDDPFWAPRVDWNFVYTYSPTYRDTLRAYDHTPATPAILGESNYEGENNSDGPPTTPETLRRQILWAMTSGAAGDFAGSRDWKFVEGWEERLDTAAVEQIGRVRQIVAKMPWWEMAPDRALVTAGQGTALANDSEADVLDSDYATAARTEEGRFGAVYIPTARTLTIDRGRLAPDVEAFWVDPSDGATRPAGTSSTFTTPGPNAAGDGDWLLILSAAPF